MAPEDALLAEIAALLAVEDGADDPDRLERTLTDGYARALALEAEQRRLTRRIVGLQGSAREAERREIATLVRQAERRQVDARALRGQLTLLRRRHSSAVRAARV